MKALAVLLAAFAAAPAAGGGVRIRGVDAGGYPTIRLAVVTSAPSSTAPSLEENGVPADGVTARNLGRRKSVVLAVDRSRSMAGAALADATAAARAFAAGKRQADRLAIVAFGSRAVALTRFSSATIDADTALRALPIDARQGTALYDAVALAARMVSAEALPGRVIVLLTDGRDVSSKATLEGAIAAARAAGAAVYPVAIEGPQFSPAPLEELAHATGGGYFGAASSKALARIYTRIADELGRTWQLEYPTAARPGELLRLRASLGRGSAASAELALPGPPPKRAPKPSPLLPAQLYRSAWGPQVLALAVGALVLLAAAFGLASRKGSRLQRRLAPHVGAPGAKGRRKERRGRPAIASALFRATERAFGELRHWRELQRLLERGDTPLRTVELVYLAAGSGLVLGLLAAVAGLSSLAILVAGAGGALAPLVAVWLRARRRESAFESQLPDLLVTLAASLKAGHSFRQGIQAVVDEGEEPASKELKRVLMETQLGRPMDEALAEMAARTGSRNFEFVITAVTIQRQVGGSLAGLFDMVADTVRQRQQFARKIRSLTAMGRASAYVLMGLPFFVALAITLLNAEYMHPLYHSSTGHTLIGVGLAMMAAGSVMLRKVVSFRG